MAKKLPAAFKKYEKSSTDLQGDAKAMKKPMPKGMKTGKGKGK